VISLTLRQSVSQVEHVFQGPLPPSPPDFRYKVDYNLPVVMASAIRLEVFCAIICAAAAFGNAIYLDVCCPALQVKLPGIAD